MNRRNIFSILVAILIVFTFLPFNAVTTYASDVRVMLDSQFIAVDPVTIDNRTLLPIRAIVEELGGEVEWNNETREVTLIQGDVLVLLTIDSHRAMVNNRAVYIDVPAQIIEGRTFLPLRFVGESLGLDIDWYSGASTVIIMTENSTVTLLEATELARNTSLMPQQTLTPGNERAFIGNINSNIFHAPTCSTLPNPRNRIYFESREDALNAGHRACLRCRP